MQTFMGALHCKTFAFQKLAEQRAQLRIIIHQEDVHGSTVSRETLVFCKGLYVE
jgi:hypothetical protein